MVLQKQILNGRFLERLSQKDIRFVVTSLAPSDGAADGLMRLLTDEGSRGMILDSPELFKKLGPLEEGTHNLSLELYFYILLRKNLREAGLDRADIAGYLAEVLARAIRARRPGLDWDEQAEGKKAPAAQPVIPLTVDMLEALHLAQGYEWFSLAVGVANQALLLMSVFVDGLYDPNRGRVAPGPNFYETTGKQHYRAAAAHRLAEEFEIRDILKTIGENFDKVRRALTAIKSAYLPTLELSRK
jgi:hypothetical protein